MYTFCFLKLNSVNNFTAKLVTPIWCDYSITFITKLNNVDIAVFRNVFGQRDCIYQSDSIMVDK